jgi:ATP-dependent Clp protease adaptor protein ClpS
MSTDVIEDVKIDEKIEKKTQEPERYKVVMLNDDQTPIDWVIEVLTTLFKHTQETAEKLTLTIHNEGSGIAGVYTYEIAEQKSVEATLASREKGFPLQIRLEKE